MNREQHRFPPDGGLSRPDSSTGVRCILCGSSRIKTLCRSSDLRGVARGTFSLGQCVGCHLTVLTPLPHGFDPETYGAQYYTHQRLDVAALTEYLRKITSTWRAQVLHDWLGYTHLATATRPSRIVALLWYVRNRRSIPRYHGDGRILDVGCGNGDTLFFYRGLGWDAYGVDPDPEACAVCRTQGLKVVQGEIFDAGFPAGFFDIVRMHHVLEHVRDPIGTLSEIRRVLKKNGLLILTVPNIDGIGFAMFKKYWIGLDIPRHLFFYSPATLRRIVEKAGFSCVRLVHLRSAGLLRNSLSLLATHRQILSPALNNTMVGTSLSVALAILGQAIGRGDTIEATFVPRS